jgi:hypothetical protein
LYVKVPAIYGIPEIGTRNLYEGISLNQTEAICHIDDGKLENGWIELTGEEFRQYVPKQKTSELSEQEIVNAELLLGQAQIIETLNAIDEATAAILPEAVGGGA